MRNFICLSIALSLLGISSAALAQSNDPTRNDISIPLTGIPDNAPLTITLTSDDLIKQCSSKSESLITLVSPENGIAVTPAPHSDETLTFTVKDGAGHETNAEVVVTRD